jgi:CTP-dependent riboflavin kinase
MLRRAAMVKQWTGVRIDGFQASGRTFGGATCIPAKIGGSPGHLIRPDRTHYEDVIEFVAPVSLRETLKLADASPIEIELEET